MCCCRGLYDNAAGWIPLHYNMNLDRLGHVPSMCVPSSMCVCVCFSVRVWSTSGPVLSFFFLLSRSLSLSLCACSHLSLSLFPRIVSSTAMPVVSCLCVSVDPSYSSTRFRVETRRPNFSIEPEEPSGIAEFAFP